MTGLDVEPDEQSIKVRCADILLLLSLKHGEDMDASQLKDKIREKDSDGYMIFSDTSREELIKRTFNFRISQNIRRGYIERNHGEYHLTENGKDRLSYLRSDTMQYLD